MRFSLIPLLTFGLLITPLARALDVYVRPVEYRGQLKDEAEVTLDLLRHAVDKTKGFTSVEPEAKAPVILSARLLLLGDTLLLTLKREGGERPAAELRVDGMDDMPLATERVVRRALIGGEDQPRVGEVTGADRRGNDRRIEGSHQFQIAFGPAWTTNLRDPGPASVWGLGYLWGVDPNFEIALKGEFLNSNQSKDVGFGGITIGLNYLFSAARHAPFANFDFGYAWAEADRGCASVACRLNSDGRDEANGWQVGLGVGYKFFRTSRVNLGLELRHDLLTVSAREGLPSKTAFKVLLYF